jgi:hypothetical protein
MMDLKTVKSCFEKYIRYLETSEKINASEKFDIENISIEDMDRLTQIIFMNYVISCDSKINQFSIPCVLYKHVNSLIRQYIQDESHKNSKTTELLKDHIFKVNEEKKNQVIKLQPVKEVKKGWFF